MVEKVTRDSFAYFIFMNMLNDQGELLKSLHEKDFLNHLTSSTEEQSKLSMYINNISKIVDKIDRNEGITPTDLKIIFPKPILVWSDNYQGVFEDRINMLMLESQTYSLFLYHKMLKLTFEELGFMKIVAILRGMMNYVYEANKWVEVDMRKLDEFSMERLLEYFEVFLAIKCGTDYFKFGRLVSKNIVKKNEGDLHESSYFVDYTNAVLIAKKEMIEKYKYRIE